MTMFRIHKGSAYSGQEQHGLLALNFYHLRGKSELLSRFTGWHSAVLLLLPLSSNHLNWETITTEIF